MNKLAYKNVAQCLDPNDKQGRELLAQTSGSLRPQDWFKLMQYLASRKELYPTSTVIKMWRLATNVLNPIRNIAKDSHYIKMCVLIAKSHMPKNPRKAREEFSTMYNRRVGRKSAHFWRAWAEYALMTKQRELFELTRKAAECNKAEPAEEMNFEGITIPEDGYVSLSDDDDSDVESLSEWISWRRRTSGSGVPAKSVDSDDPARSLFKSFSSLSEIEDRIFPLNKSFSSQNGSKDRLNFLSKSLSTQVENKGNMLFVNRPGGGTLPRDNFALERHKSILSTSTSVALFDSGKKNRKVSTAGQPISRAALSMWKRIQVSRTPSDLSWRNDKAIKIESSPFRELDFPKSNAPDWSSRKTIPSFIDPTQTPATALSIVKTEPQSSCSFFSNSPCVKTESPSSKLWSQKVKVEPRTTPGYYRKVSRSQQVFQKPHQQLLTRTSLTPASRMDFASPVKRSRNEATGGVSARLVKAHLQQNRSCVTTDLPRQKTTSLRKRRCNRSTNTHPPTKRSKRVQRRGTAGIKVPRVTVQGKNYIQLEQVGKGGSSTVYRVIGRETKETYALKVVRVSPGMRTLHENEIELLKNLKGKKNIIDLIAHEAKVVEGKELIFMIFEFGEVDLATLLKKAGPGGFGDDIPYVRVVWKQVLEVVKTIHEERVVHGDLKPANFLNVKCELKLIDFGIAKAINTHTMNIYRDSQIGTANYMAPEAIVPEPLAGGESTNGPYKLSTKADVWSLGCILHQLCFGDTPFTGMGLMQKLACISGQRRFRIKTHRLADINDVIQGCLKRDPEQRFSIAQLLSHPFLQNTEVESIKKLSVQLRKRIDILEADNGHLIHNNRKLTMEKQNLDYQNKLLKLRILELEKM